MRNDLVEEFGEFYQDALDFWGEDAQLRMCIEEMSELTKELCKYFRLVNSEKTPEIQKKLEENRLNVIEETADVYNMIDQVARLFGEQEVYEMRKRKIERTQCKLNEYRKKYGADKQD